MRVMLDSNIFFSYLLLPENASGTIVKVLEAALAMSSLLSFQPKLLRKWNTRL